MEREVEKLRERIEARRLVLAGRPVASVGTWFTGAGLSLASGFMTGVSGSIPSEFDRDTFLRLLMRAAAEAIATAAAFVTTYPPGMVPDAPSPHAAADAAAAAAEADTQITRAELLMRLRRQSEAGDRAG